MSKPAQEQMQIIQNNALRIALKMGFNKETGKNERISKLHETAEIITVKERCKHLKEKYLLNAIKDCNPMICDLVNEYKAFSGARILKVETLFENIEVFDIELPQKYDLTYKWP